jgi:uncharacterized protein YkwD
MIENIKRRNAMKYYFFVLMTVGMLLSGCGGATGASSTSIPIVAPSISDADKQAYLDAINDARNHVQDCGTQGIFAATTPLTWNNALYKAAYEHDYDMLESDIVNADHTGSNTASDYTARVLGLGHGSTIQERIENNGYGAWTTLGENLTNGTLTDTAVKAVQAWLASDDHCANLMNPVLEEVGMAHIEQAGSHYTHYWTQDFGAK